jgi:hypothetical protein
MNATLLIARIPKAITIMAAPDPTAIEVGVDDPGGAFSGTCIGAWTSSAVVPPGSTVAV